ncbi:hypothetical protein C2S53_005145 [Perilla frutescens var. hirtella]|uniref:Uncharacterized protein n=1 Tax=Perilla frutescens var. hirtella TaxID=608512 RepID=A0AAD4JN61_PERFH|nr:hypothetical protein C2S53_005145 [Perilla frutescens var. hirtella]
MAQKFPNETRRSEPSTDFEILAFDAMVGLISGTQPPTSQPQQQAHRAQIALKASSPQIMGGKSKVFSLRQIQHRRGNPPSFSSSAPSSPQEIEAQTTINVAQAQIDANRRRESPPCDVSRRRIFV